MQAFRSAVELNPANGAAQQNLANALLGTGDVDEAVGPAVMAATLRPADPAVHHLLGRIWAAQGKSGAAADEFRKAIQLGAPER
jgi:Flp pilus assembly protein TadD